MKPNNGYLWNNYLWTITSSVYIAYFIHSNSFVDYDLDTDYAFQVWPTLYLKPTVKILPNPNSEQDYGSINNPFILS